MDDAKLHLRVDASDEDPLIAGYIAAARAWVEAECGIQIMRAEWQLTLDRFPRRAIYLPKPPLVSISSIEYTDTSGTTQTLNASAYVVDTTPAIGRITLAHNQSWPSTVDEANAVAVTYLSGYADRSELPASIRALLLLMVGEFYEHREAVSSLTLREVPMAAQTLASHLRVQEFI